MGYYYKWDERKLKKGKMVMACKSIIIKVIVKKCKYNVKNSKTCE